jgi:hypothetical protein
LQNQRRQLAVLQRFVTEVAFRQAARRAKSRSMFCGYAHLTGFRTTVCETAAARLF